MNGRHLWRFMRWLGSAAVFILVVITIMFLLLELTPGDPIQSLIGNMPVTDELRAQLTAQFGLDQPLLTRYFTYLGNILQGDFGYSYAGRQDVLPLVLDRLGNTLVLVIPALFISSVMGIFFGALAATARSRGFDNAVSMISIGLFSLPGFWLGLVLIILFAVQLQWLPSQGMRGYTSRGMFSVPHMVLPVLTMAITEFAFMMRLMRATMIEVLGQDYIDTARSKGLSRTQIIFRHALPNSMLPMITVIGSSIGFTVAGTVLIEKVFGWPGMGMLLYESIQRSENMVVMAILLITAVIVIVVNLLTDAVMALVDPRLRKSLISGGAR